MVSVSHAALVNIWLMFTSTLSVCPYTSITSTCSTVFSVNTFSHCTAHECAPIASCATPDEISQPLLSTATALLKVRVAVTGAAGFPLAV
jgi:predicted solute-binding protein